MSEYITLNLSPVQLVVLRGALKLEIATEGKLRATRTGSALQHFHNIVGEKAGMKKLRGQKGREEALAIVDSLLAQVEKG